MGLIFFTKLLMTKYRFIYPATIACIHFTTTAGGLWGARQLGAFEGFDLHFKYVAALAVVGSVSVATATFSLMLNSVTTYQIAKLLLAPGIALIEAYWLGRQFTVQVFISLAFVLAGVVLFILGTPALTASGVAVAAAFVLSSTLQQVMVWSYQARFKIEAHQLLAKVAPVQALLLLLLGPLVDKLAVAQWLTQWEVNVPGVETLLITCALALLANYSQYLFLVRGSAWECA